MSEWEWVYAYAYTYTCVHMIQTYMHAHASGDRYAWAASVSRMARFYVSQGMHLCSTRSKLIFSNGIDELFMKYLAWRMMRMNNFTHA